MAETNCLPISFSLSSTQEDYISLLPLKLVKATSLGPAMYTELMSATSRTSRKQPV